MRNFVYSLRRAIEIWSTFGFIELCRYATAHFLGSRYRQVPIIKWLYLRNKRYSDASVSKIINIDPNCVEYETLTKVGHTLNEPGSVYAGRWDKARSEFHQRYKVHSLRRYFQDNVSWTETEYYTRKRSSISKNEWRGCATEEELLQFLERIDNLYDRIKSDGYKTQKELLEQSPEETKKLNNDAPSPELNEIGVNIGRNGEFLWQYGGQHRLCIAQLLDLDKVPVRVLTRHEQWQAIRDEIKLAKSYSALTRRSKSKLHHPDLRDIIPEEWSQ